MQGQELNFDTETYSTWKDQNLFVEQHIVGDTTPMCS